MDFNFDNLNPSETFLFDDSDESNGFVCLRTIPPEEMKKINKKTDKKRVEHKRGGRYEYTDRNDKLWNDLFWDYVITDWDVTNKGEPVECNRENKSFLMNNSVKFMNFVSTKFEELTEMQENIEDETEKNL